MLIDKPTLSRAQVLDLVRESWPGPVGTARALAVDALLNERLPDYAEAFGIDEGEVFRLLEHARNYSPVTYYQKARLPPSSDLRIFRTQAELIEAFQPERGFRCPACGGVSERPGVCTSGRMIGEKNDEKVCDWRANGMFSTLGMGMRVVIIEQFLKDGMIHEIFMPIALEEQEQEGT